MPTQAEIVESLGQMSIMQIRELTTALEDKWGVKAAPPPVQGILPEPPKPPDEVMQTEFDVVLVSAGAKKIDVIKAVREATGLGLKEAKDLVEREGPTVIKSSLPTAEAKDLQTKLLAAGAQAILK